MYDEAGDLRAEAHLLAVHPTPASIARAWSAAWSVESRSVRACSFNITASRVTANTMPVVRRQVCRYACRTLNSRIPELTTNPCRICSALAFAVALLASGLSSSSVGTYAGQVVMQGFIRRRIPLFARRTLTMLPALAVLALGLPVTETLVFSQVLLSFGIPFALIPLAMVTRRADVMGSLVNSRRTTAVMITVAAGISVLNVYLVYTTFFG